MFYFSRALWQYLETRVTPLLAGVVAYADTNANLDLLMEDGDNLWISFMWLDMFSNADIAIIKYKLVWRTIVPVHSWSLCSSSVYLCVHARVCAIHTFLDSRTHQWSLL